jgi:hypothetical protein
MTPFRDKTNFTGAETFGGNARTKVSGLLTAMSVKGAPVASGSPGESGGISSGGYKTISVVMEELDLAMIDRFEALRAALMALGDDVQETTLKFYVAFKRIKNFACVEFRPTAAKMFGLRQSRSGECTA